MAVSSKQISIITCQNRRVRGWTLDTLKVVRRLGKPRFRIGDVYEFEEELQADHPSNHNVRPKIRQQMQVLRDLTATG